MSRQVQIPEELFFDLLDYFFESEWSGAEFLADNIRKMVHILPAPAPRCPEARLLLHPVRDVISDPQDALPEVLVIEGVLLTDSG